MPGPSEVMFGSVPGFSSASVSNLALEGVHKSKDPACTKCLPKLIEPNKTGQFWRYYKARKFCGFPQKLIAHKIFTPA